MASGVIIWRCRQCGNKSKGTCKCPSAGYSIVYRVGKRQKWEAVGRLKKDAQRRLTEVKNDLYQGTYREPSKITFRAFSGRWLKKHEGKVKPTTFRSYSGIIKLHLNPLFGDLLLNQIGLEEIEKLVSVCKTTKEHAPRTINYSTTVLGMILEYACDDGLLRKNPVTKIDRQAKEHREAEYLRPDEIQKLIQHSEEPYKTIFLTAILSGMRRGELLGLQWGDIDGHNNTIHVRRSVFWYLSSEASQEDKKKKKLWAFSSPKSKRSVRAISMTPKLREILQIHRIKCPVSPHDLVFCTKQGTPFHPDSLVKNHFLTALDSAELRRIPFHALRHTFTTLLIARGDHPKFIQSQLGHSSFQLTMDLYGHLLPQQFNQASDLLDSSVFQSQFTPNQKQRVA